MTDPARGASGDFDCDTPVGSPPTADIHIDYLAVAAAPSQGRLPIQSKKIFFPLT